MLPFHKYLSNASTQEGREKETRSPGVRAKNTHELYIQNGTPIVLEHKFSVCRAVLLCRLQALQLDKHPNRPGLARQKHPVNVLSRVNVQELGTNVFILTIPGRSSSLCLLPSLTGDRLRVCPDLENSAVKSCDLEATPVNHAIPVLVCL